MQYYTILRHPLLESLEPPEKKLGSTKSKKSKSSVEAGKIKIREKEFDLDTLFLLFANILHTIAACTPYKSIRISLHQ
jgi:hypothetical protein